MNYTPESGEFRVELDTDQSHAFIHLPEPTLGPGAHTMSDGQPEDGYHGWIAEWMFYDPTGAPLAFSAWDDGTITTDEGDSITAVDATRYAVILLAAATAAHEARRTDADLS